jgi:hypothetical protein
MRTTIPIVKAYRRRPVRIDGRVYETATEFVLKTWYRIEETLGEANLVAPAIRVALSTLPQTLPAHLEQPFPHVDVCCFNEDAGFLDAASKVPIDPLKEYFRTNVFRRFDVLEVDAKLRFECSRAARGEMPNLTYKRLPELLTAPSVVAQELAAVKGTDGASTPVPFHVGLRKSQAAGLQDSSSPAVPTVQNEGIAAALPAGNKSSGPRLAFDLPTLTVTLDGEAFAGLDPTAFRLLKAIHDGGARPVSSRELQRLPQCHDKNVRRELNKLPKALLAIVSGKPGSGRWIELPVLA